MDIVIPGWLVTHGLAFCAGIGLCIALGMYYNAQQNQ